MAMNNDGRWPALPLDSWRDTYDTLHMWTQVVGKVALATTPLVNHYWNIALHLTARGLATLPLRSGDRTLTATFDLISHQLVLQCSDGNSTSVSLEPRTVADFHAATMAAFRKMGFDVHIWTMPREFPDPIPFEKDTTHRAYDRKSVEAFWGALVAMQPVFEKFRAKFLGKCSPLHFFWGSFDVALTRFSGRRAPEKPDADPVTRESYSHEVISHGFWPGGGGVDEAAFYAYAAPEPEGLKAVKVRPAAARYDTAMNEFILPYEAVRASKSPEEDLMAFLESTYVEAANLAKWDRRALER